MNIFLMTMALSMAVFTGTVDAAGVYVENGSNYEIKVLIGSKDADLCTNTYEVVAPQRNKIFDYGICRLSDVAINFGNSRNIVCTDESGYQGRYRQSTNSVFWDGKRVPQAWSNWLNITCKNKP